MGGFRRRIALAAALFALPAQAMAGNGISNITLRREPNLTSVAIQAIVSGDNDSSAVLRIFQRWRENPTYDTGMVMVRRVGTNIHEARILWMTPGRTAYWYVEGRDALGNFVTPVQLAIVQPIHALTATGPVFYVNQRTGDDAWNGTNPNLVGLSGPKRTIRAAVSALAASPNAGRNGGVIVAPGEYHERLTLNFGSDGDRHFLAGDGTNRDSTIICGANPLVEKGFWAPGQPLSWKLTQDSTYVTRFDGSSPGSSPGDSTQLLVIGWGEYIHRKTSIRAVLNDSTYAGVPASTNEGELSGWYWQHDSLYVKRRNGLSPNGTVLHTGYLDDLIDVQRRNWHISNLTLRFSGGFNPDMAHPSNPRPLLSGHGIVAGVQGIGSGLVVDSCRFYGHNSDAIYIVHGALGQHADSVTIAHCFVDGLTVGSMAYSASKARAEERVGEIQLLSRAANVYDNVITGGFNGMYLGPGDLIAGPRDSTWGSQNEIAYNTITNVSNAGIKLDSSHSINTLVFGNTIRDAGHGLTQVPTYTGPTWVFYNTIVNTRNGGIKVGGGSTGISWYIHNTFAGAGVGGWAIDGSPGGPVDNMHFRNNIMVARGKFYGYTVWGPSNANLRTNDFNYDLMDSVSTWQLVYWGGNQYSFPLMQTVLGWEKNGVRAAPNFVDSARFNWSLLPASLAIGRGQRITGVNTSLDGPRYKGRPDIGAAGSLAPLTDVPLLPVGPRLTVRFAPNPFRNDAVLEYALPSAAEVTVRIYDLSGRVMRSMLEHEQQPAGSYRLPLHGRALPPGIYLYEITAGDERAQGKLVLIR